MKLDWKSCVLFVLLLYNGIILALAEVHTEFSKAICENKSATVTCPSGSGQFMNITYANYGRLSNSYCPISRKVTNCRAAVSLIIVRNKCHGLNSCTLQSSNSVFGDPCVSVFKYLEIRYTCVNGNNFPSIPSLGNAYVYKNQMPFSHVMNLTANESLFVEPPYYYSIFNIAQVQLPVEGKSNIYENALSFLASSQYKPSTRSGVCSPNINDQASEFCIYRNNGYLYLRQTFIPGMNLGKSYKLSILVRDSSATPLVRKTTLAISVVPACFPMTELYRSMKANCTHNAVKLRFPSSFHWSGTLYGKRIPIAAPSPATIAKVYIDVDLLANFYESSAVSARYNITLFLKDREYQRTFVYYKQAGNAGTTNGLPQVSGSKLNITLHPPIEVTSLDKFVNVSLKLISPQVRTDIVFNSENSVLLYGSKKLEVCPGSLCLDAYKSWANGISKLRFTSKHGCIVDDFLQEEYLKPCRSIQNVPQVDIPHTSSGNDIIFDMKKQVAFGSFQPTFFRVINCTVAGVSYAGYSEKYFCVPAPFEDGRKFICLNRYKGRLRIRSTTASGFALLPIGYRFTFEIQAENTASNSPSFRVFVVEMIIVKPGATITATVVTTKISTTATIAQPATTKLPATGSVVTTKPSTAIKLDTTVAATPSSSTTAPSFTSAASQPAIAPSTVSTTTQPATNQLSTTSSAVTTKPATTTAPSTRVATTTASSITKIIATNSTSSTLITSTKNPVTLSRRELCNKAANCTQNYQILRPVNNSSDRTMLTYKLGRVLSSVRFRLWSVSLDLAFPLWRVRLEIYGLSDMLKIPITNSTLALTNNTNTIMFDSNLPNNCDRIALQIFNMSNHRHVTLDSMPNESITVSIATFDFCENNHCVELYDLWNFLHFGSYCPGSPFARYSVCSESLLLVVPQSTQFFQPLKLVCQGNSTAQITWHKDNAVLKSTNKELSLNGQAYLDQGYYQCVAKSSGLQLSSREILFQFNDVYKSTLYLEITNQAFTTDLNDQSSLGYKDLSNQLVQSVVKVLTGLPSKRPHDVNVEQFSGTQSVLAKLQIYSNVLAQTSTESFYSNMKKLLLAGVNDRSFGSLQISSQTIIILNHDYCLPQTTNQETSKGPYSWPLTQFQRNISIKCPSGPAGKHATRVCSGNFTAGAVWLSVRDIDCGYNNKRTQQLDALSKIVVNESNAASVATELEKLTTNASSLTTDDTVLASEAFSNVVAMNVTSDKIVDDLLLTASNLLQVNETVLSSSQSNKKALTNIVKGIESLADKIQLPNNSGEAVVKVASGVAIQAVQLDNNSSSVLTFAFKKPDFNLQNVISNQKYQANDVSIGISLPETILSDIKGKSASRLSFVAYKGGQFFQSTKKDALGHRVRDPAGTPNSMIISAHVKGEKRVNLSKPLNGTFKKLNASLADKCVFWDFAANDGYGGWSSKGCRKLARDNRVVCQCDHMTNFAILFDVYAGKQKSSDETHEEILGIITFIGIGLSLGGLGITLLTLALFRRLRRNLPSRILIHLCLSLMLTLLCFVIGADMTTPVYACRGFAMAIQYFLLVCFSWMVVEAVNLYLSFVIVMGTYISRFMIKAGLCAWGLPLIIVGFTAWQRFEDYGNERYCVVTGWAAYGTLFAPICLAILMNFIVFVMVLRSLMNSAKGKKISKDQKRSGTSQLRIAATFSCILGLTWVFGLFAIADARIVFQYLFCIFNGLQGFTIFFLHVARQREARNHWIHFLTGNGLNYYRSSLMSTSRGKTVRPPRTGESSARISSTEKSATLTSNLSNSDTLKLSNISGRLNNNASVTLVSSDA